MKRRIFFWLEKLKITPAERKTISILLIVLSAFTLSNMALSSSRLLEEDQYLELRQQFHKRTAQLKAKKKKRMERYYPSEEKPAKGSVISDTLPQGTPKVPESKKESQKVTSTQKNRINVNTANQEALKTLPGIGPAYSNRIIIYREKNGRFKTHEELKKIKGIGPKRLEKLIPFIKLKDSE